METTHNYLALLFIGLIVGSIAGYGVGFNLGYDDGYRDGFIESIWDFQYHTSYYGTNTTNITEASINFLWWQELFWQWEGKEDPDFVDELIRRNQEMNEFMNSTSESDKRRTE